jgi:hypothetical protein
LIQSSPTDADAPNIKRSAVHSLDEFRTDGGDTRFKPLGEHLELGVKDICLALSRDCSDCRNFSPSKLLIKV